MLSAEHLGDPKDILKKPPVKVGNKDVELIDLTNAYGYGAPLWPYFQDIGVARMHYHAKSRVLSQEVTHVMHMGTHADAPAHVEEEYPFIDQVPIERYVGKGVIVDIPKKKWQVITAEDLENAEPAIESGDIVIIHTGWHKFWGDSVKYFVFAPGLYKEAGEWLLKKKVKGVGVDTQALDHPLATMIAQPPPILPWVLDAYKAETGRTVSEDFPYWEPAHRLMLTNGIVGWENVGGDIDRAVGKRCTIVGLPTKWINGDGSNVRLVAMLEKS
ncbi:MAG: cyclase family protein [Nitrososphaerales archaeon]